MRPPKIFRSKHNIAVAGLYRSGKSVFITSLINHILHHRPEYLNLGNGDVQITFNEELPSVNGFDRFPYDEFRNDCDGRWPRKTKTTSEYRCSFFRSDWFWAQGELAVVDIPGERLADIPMAKRTYAAWSDWLLERIFQDPQYRKLSGEFLSVVNCEGAGENEITLAYRRMLVRLYRSYRPVITPSTFLLQPSGEFNGLNLMQDDISNSFPGLSEDEQFAPLPKEMRRSNVELTKRFDKHYQKYRKQIVAPLTIALSRCNELAILIDVTTLLAANTGMYNGNRALLEETFENLSPGKGFFEVCADLPRLTFGGHLRNVGISKIAIIATKADKVHESQRDKLTQLAKEMMVGVVNKHMLKSTQLDCKYFHCAAVKSTNFQPNGRLRGKLLGEVGFSEYEVSELPDKWPGKWQVNDFVFPDVAPDFPENEAVPPDHLGMDGVIDFLLSAQL